MLIAQSLGCRLVAHWAMRSPRPVASALLVAVPDPAEPAFPKAEDSSFGEIPDGSLPFPALNLASMDDPYASLAYSRGKAQAWRAAITVAGAVGHINADAGLGDWPQGSGLLRGFLAELSAESGG